MEMDKISLNPDMMRVKELFAPNYTLAWKFLEAFEWPWTILPEIGNIVQKIAAELDPTQYNILENNVFIHKSASIAPSAHIGKSVIIGADTEVRHCAFIRENAIISGGTVVGNSTELKNVILFDKVQVPHFNYVGDSILGYKSHLGAGAITSNVKSDKTLVTVHYEGQKIETGLKKFGAILGDHVEVGCNSVLNPGSVIGSGTAVYPLSSVRGFVPADSIYKKQGVITPRR
ncbi:MAG: UDP-N-acetylglucosamine pyrophosphorylase [Oscillospiraceae bacterium]|nr:UDP-N-acetylglucosamine pyrophosphorylase [Oscillospiraceae bacterium]